jgi:Ca2+-transporting ATPase
MAAERRAERLPPSPHAVSIGDVAGRLGVDLRSGWTSQQAAERLAKHGANELPKAPETPFWRRLLAQLRGVIVLILLAAVAVSIALGDWIEAGVILAIVLLNALVGALQESRAAAALQSLQELAAPTARVLRDARAVEIAAREVVPGDVVLLDTGAIVPADLRLTESSHLRIDESSLTGESAPVGKRADAAVDPSALVGDRVNCAFSGSTVTYGRGIGIAVATGPETELGKIAAEIGGEPDEPTPLQRKLDEFGRITGASVLGICALVFVVGFFRNPEASLLFRDGFAAYITNARTTISGLFVVAVSLAVAAVPEGLPAVVTMSLALGTRDMLRRNALVRRLPSVETLGSTTVICTDKTGTLTQNRMTVASVRTVSAEYEFARSDGDGRLEILRAGEPVDPRRHGALYMALVAGLLCNDAEAIDGEASRFLGDPTEGALVLAAAEAGLEPRDAYPPRDAEIPFDSDRKRMTTVHRTSGGLRGFPAGSPYVAFVKGAPEGMIGLCGRAETDEGPVRLSETDRGEILEANRAMGERGLRLLSVAYRPLDRVDEEPKAADVESELTFLGLVALHDPPRPEAAEAVETARRAGLRSVMITGDHAATARAIAERVGILRPEGVVVTGAELDRMDADELRRTIGATDVFARVSPQHKVRIVDALKANGEVVAMTGDGVNDAPALKRADVGIAMGITGTDVAKQTADMVLTDDNYATIVAAIEKGRVIYANIRKTVFYLLSCNFAEIAILFIATLVGWPPPLAAIQLLWLNLVTDGAPALALAMEKGERGIMDRPPRAADERIVNARLARGILFQASVLTAAVLAAFGAALYGGRPDAAGTVAFATLAVAELLRAYTARSEDVPLLTVGVSSNRWMQAAVLTSLGLVLAVLYVPFLRSLFDVRPIGASLWAWILPLAVGPALLIEARKGLRPLGAVRRKRDGS